MAASQVSGMKMRTLLFGVILGLLAVVHSTPVHNVTQIPAKAEDEVIREAVTDGFLVDNLSLPSGATGSPATESPATESRGSPAANVTVQTSQPPATDSKEGVAIEGSGGEAIVEATTSVSVQFGSTTASHAPSSASTMSAKETGDSSSVSSATQSPPSSSTPVPNEAQPSATPNHISASQTTDPAVSTFDFLSSQGSESDSGSGSGDGEMFGPYFTTTTHSSMTSGAETSAESSTSTTRQKVLARMGVSGLELGTEGLPAKLGDTEPNKGEVELASRADGTPGWMIIVGFIVGLAALVMLFVAIATRDRWNGPSRASTLEDKANSSNQQREVEMETFLQKDQPKENGHGSEYTVIPLEELPEKYSSH